MPKEKNKILVTGAGGFLGKSLVDYLVNNKKVGVTAITREPVNFNNKQVQTMVGDLTDYVFCQRALMGVETVYYLAGFKKNISVHVGQPFSVMEANVAPLINFLKAVKDSKVKQIIYISSVIVGYIEDSSEHIDGYVWGKYANELLIKAFAKETGISVKVVRSAPIYGPGDNFDLTTANLIPSLMIKADQSTDELLLWGTGKRLLQFVYVDDLVKNIVATVESVGSLFIFGDSRKISINNLAKKIIRLSGKKLKLKNDLTKPDKPTQIIKFKNIVKPQVSLDDGLDKTWCYYKSKNK